MPKRHVVRLLASERAALGGLAAAGAAPARTLARARLPLRHLSPVPQPVDRPCTEHELARSSDAPLRSAHQVRVAAGQPSSARRAEGGSGPGPRVPAGAGPPVGR